MGAFRLLRKKTSMPRRFEGKRETSLTAFLLECTPAGQVVESRVQSEVIRRFMCTVCRSRILYEQTVALLSDNLADDWQK